MLFNFDERPSESSLIEKIWRTQSGQGEGKSFISLAEPHWEMVITKQVGKTTLTMRGPETIAMDALIKTLGLKLQ